MTDEEHSRREAAAKAAQLRLASTSSASSSSDNAEAIRKHKLKIKKHINELTGSLRYEVAFACLQLLLTLVDNVVSHPEELKYRHFKANQPKIAATVLSQSSAVDILVEAGFRTRTHDFQQQWFVPEDWKPGVWAWTRLQVTADSLREKAQEWEAQAEMAKLSAQREKAFESARKSRALDEAREDREKVALRVERERQARQAAAAAQQQAKEEEQAKEAEERAKKEEQPKGNEEQSSPKIASDDQ